jgi:hypothetical protein
LLGVTSVVAQIFLDYKRYASAMAVGFFVVTS